jgi:predicted RNA-binding protein with RPS1 domain
MDNYIKAGKLTPIRIQKRNYFAINQVKGLMHIPEVPKVRGYYEDIHSILQHINQLNKKCVDW